MGTTNFRCARKTPQEATAYRGLIGPAERFTSFRAQGLGRERFPSWRAEAFPALHAELVGVGPHSRCTFRCSKARLAEQPFHRVDTSIREGGSMAY